MKYRQSASCMGLVMFFIFQLSYAQNAKVIQTLNAELKQAQHDSIKCELYDQFVEQYIYSDIEKTKSYNDSLTYLSKSRRLNKWLWQAKLNTGTIYRFDGQYLDADSLFRALIDEAKTQNNTRQLMEAYYQLASVNINLSRGKESLIYYQQAAEIAEEMDDAAPFLSKVYNGMGTIHSSMGNTLESSNYLKKAITISEQLADTNNLMIAYNSLGILYTRTNSNEQAAECFSKSLKLAKAQRNLTVMGMQLRNIGLIAWLKGDLETAKGNYLEALGIRKQAGDPLRILGSHYDLGQLFASDGHFEKSEFHFNKALKLADKISSIDSKYKVLIGLADMLEKKGAYKKALEYTRQSNLLSDSMSLVDIQKNMLDLEKKYESAKKDVQLKDQKLQISKQTSQRRIFIGLIALLALIAIFILAFMRHRIKTKQRIASQANELQQQRIDRLEKEKQILNLAGMIEGQEAERIRIAKDLHDGLGGLLTTIKTQVANIQKDIDQLEKVKRTKKPTQ